MIVSHRRHVPGFGDACLAIDRAIGPSFIVRRVALREVVQDERLTKAAVGVDCGRPRRRLLLVLDGESLESIEGRDEKMHPGRALFISERRRWESRSEHCDLLEIEWDPGGLDDGSATSEDVASWQLGSRTRHCVDHFGEELRNARTAEALRPALLDLFRALQSEGCPVDAERLCAVAPSTPAEQQLGEQVDRALSDLANAPMLVDLEATQGSSRRTLTRNIRRLHERHALLGRGEGRWRGIRDAYRLVIATILLSHDEATPARVAEFVGYGSVEALDHAFHHVSLPSPTALRRSIRAA
ncbi:hypothetical protein AKJ09_01947 [Labilithrix luteola]|uniref:Uncharacterized protein n=1 Tax=Labilithrix luteola TaxID=1391654 RepID=A0A0K1PP37_9BACT|nr:hypothetical protein [Labilithrix luteola]AKU95283.1 hypothetical protein AKJ09_01947 [Labilithrix luteola]